MSSICGAPEQSRTAIHTDHRMTQTLLYTEKEAREAETAAAPNDCRFLRSPEVCPRKTQAVSGSALQHHVTPCRPPPLLTRAVRLQCSTPIFSFCCMESTVSLSRIFPVVNHHALILKVFSSHEIHKAQWVTHLLFLLLIAGDDKSVYKHLVRDEFN